MTHNNGFLYEPAVAPSLVNMDPTRLSNVIDLFQHQQAKGAFPGGQLVIRRHGKVALNIAIGVARGAQSTTSNLEVEVRAETPFPVYSAGKPFFAIALAMLEERKVINMASKVADFIPEFSCHGKDQITILDLLTHTAGIIIPTLQQHYLRMNDYEFVRDLVINAKPMYKRGTFAYMPWESGVILDEVVRRAVGQTLAEFITQELLSPINLLSLRYGLAGRAPSTLAHSYWLGKNKCIIACCNVADNFETIFNSKELFDSMNPATSMVTDAASLSVFYEFLLNGGVTRSGKQLIEEKTIHQYTARVICGWNKSFNSLLAVSKGFMLGTNFLPTIYGWWNAGGCFGHAGVLSSLAFADYKTGLAVAILTNGNRSIIDCAMRFMPLVTMIRKAAL